MENDYKMLDEYKGDLAFAFDGENWSAWLQTRAQFGCPMWQENKPQK